MIKVAVDLPLIPVAVELPLITVAVELTVKQSLITVTVELHLITRKPIKRLTHQKFDRALNSLSRVNTVHQLKDCCKSL